MKRLKSEAVILLITVLLLAVISILPPKAQFIVRTVIGVVSYLLMGALIAFFGWMIGGKSGAKHYSDRELYLIAFLWPWYLLHVLWVFMEMLVRKPKAEDGS